MAKPAKSHKAGPEPKPQQECDATKQHFFDNITIYEKMAKELETEVNFIMALSSHESGWLDDHNAQLKNLFGLTRAGGNNLSFQSYEACADYWVKNYKAYVQGSKTIEAFVAGLRKAKYNTIDPDYDNKLKRQLTSIIKWKNICKVQ